MKACICILILTMLSCWSAHADVIFDMTTIADPGNPADVHWWGTHGSVSYIYQIGTYEVTVGQYTEFLNATAQSDPYGLWDENMGDGGGINIPIIARSGESGSYSYSSVYGREDEPVRYVSFYRGMRFCNWMANGQGSGDTETGSYDLSLGITVPRGSNATWVIPSNDEWYKAAYYDPDTQSYFTYPNGSDDEPAEPTDSTTIREMNFGDDPYWNPDGGAREYYTQIGQTTGHSPYGVYDMGGNVQEWTDTMVLPANRLTRGGQLFDPAENLDVTFQDPADPTTDGDLFGFRVAYVIQVPEPSTVMLLVLGALGCLLFKRR